MLEEVAYWTHIGIVLVFLNLLRVKHFHVITSIFNVFFSEISTTPRGAIRAIENIEEQETFGVSHVMEFDANQLLDLHLHRVRTLLNQLPHNHYGQVAQREAAHYRYRDQPIAERGAASAQRTLSRLRRAVAGGLVGYDAIWDCTTCRACSEACPVMIEHVDKIVDLRRHCAHEARFPKELGQLGTSSKRATHGGCP